MSTEQSIPLPTEESIARLHVVNKIRDGIKEHAIVLIDAGILEVLLFGSVENGTAKADSDIDLCFIYSSEYDGFIEFTNTMKKMRSAIEQALSRCGKEVSFHPPRLDKIRMWYMSRSSQ
jgi:predicted nucleotidyltransferase